MDYNAIVRQWQPLGTIHKAFIQLLFLDVLLVIRSVPGGAVLDKDEIVAGEHLLEAVK